MEVIYKIGINISLTHIEAGLLYKYLKMHPFDRQYIGEGHFAFGFNNFEQNNEFELTLTTEIIDSCMRVLEDQDLNDPMENELKKELLEKIYFWSQIIDNEQCAFDELENDYYLNCSEEFNIENGDFSFENYLKFNKLRCRNEILKKRKTPIFEKIKQFFDL